MIYIRHLCLHSVITEEKIITTNQEKNTIQRLRQELERKYDGLFTQKKLLILYNTYKANSAAIAPL